MKLPEMQSYWPSEASSRTSRAGGTAQLLEPGKSAAVLRRFADWRPTIWAITVGLAAAGCTKSASPSAPASESGGAAAAPAEGGGALSAPQYSLATPAVTLHPGQTGTVTLAVDMAAGWHFSADYPTRVHDFKSGGRVSSTVEGFRNEPGSPPEIHLETASLRVAVPVKAEGAGSDSLTARVRFAACSKETCVPVEAEARWAVRVE